MNPDEVLRASLQEGIRMFCTTAGVRIPEDEVPINPLPDQVSENGSDPEETNSDQAEDDHEGGEEADAGGVGDDSAPLGEDEKRILEADDVNDSECEEVGQRKPQNPLKRTSTKRVMRKRSNAASTTPQSKNEALATAIPAKARLPSCDIGIVELLCFFPNHTKWPEAGIRAYRNEWKHGEVARIQLHARGKLTRDAYEKRIDCLKHQILCHGKHYFGDPTFKPTTHGHLMTPVVSYDASNYAPRNNQGLFDASLMDIAEGVVNWPVGQDRGIVSQAIEYAHNNGLDHYTTADIPRIAQQMGFVAPAEASGDDWDRNAKGQVAQIAGHVPAALP